LVPKDLARSATGADASYALHAGSFASSGWPRLVDWFV